LARARTTAPRGTEDLAQGDELYTLRYSFKSQDMGTYANTNWTATFQKTWNSIFGILAPLMINEAAEPALESAIDQFVADQNKINLAKNKKLKDSTLSQFSLNREDFQTLKVQLRALGLITKSEKTRSIKDMETYWTLTPYGDEVMTRLIAIKRTIVSKEVPVVEKDTKSEN